MKALSLLQPWATLVAIGAKKIETRSWKTDYRGPLKIHASSTRKPELDSLSLEWSKRYHLPINLLIEVHRGKVIATCELVRVAQIGSVSKRFGWEWRGPDGRLYRYELTDMEREFGDYALGRYAWMLDNVVALSFPVPAKGSLRLWDVDYG